MRDDVAEVRLPIGPTGLELELVHPRRGEQGGWELTWDWVIGCDAVFLQRPAHPVHAQFAKLVKALGLPLWVEWDDDYTCIPVSNPHWEQYADQETHARAIAEIARLADVITVATPELKRRIVGMIGGTINTEQFDRRDKIVVVPNACHAKFYDEPRRRVVLWRGTDTHEEDVCTVLKELGEVARTYPVGAKGQKWTFHFSGGVPWQVYQAIPKERMEESPFSGPVFFVPLLSLMGGWVQIVPLKHNRFNACKSNVAWIEATCAGSVVLAPDGEEWRRPGIVNYRTAQEFQEKLRGLMQDYEAAHQGAKEGEFVLHPNVALSRKYIAENLRLREVNQLRWEIVEKLHGLHGEEIEEKEKPLIIADNR